jgi:paraquat-inducible protein A
MIACHECDLLQRAVALPPKGALCCARCGAVLRRDRPDSLRRTLAWLLGAAILFIVSLSFPIVAMEIQGERTVATLVGAAQALRHEGMESVAILVFITTVISPLLQISSMLYILWPLQRGYIPPNIELAFRLVQNLKQWGMVEVFILGVLVSLVKLSGMAQVMPDIAMWSFAGLIVMLTAAASSFEPEEVWDRIVELRRGSMPSRAETAA